MNAQDLTFGDLLKQLTADLGMPLINTHTGLQHGEVSHATLLFVKGCDCVEVGDFEIRPRYPTPLGPVTILRLLEKLEKQQNENTDRLIKVMAKVSTLADTLNAISDKITTAQSAITTEIQTLTTELGNMDEDIPDAAQASIDRLNSLATSLAAIVPPVSESTSTTPAPNNN